MRKIFLSITLSLALLSAMLHASTLPSGISLVGVTIASQYTNNLQSSQVADGVTFTGTTGDIFKFNTTSNSGSLPQTMSLTLGGTQIGAVDFSSKYAGVPFVFSHNGLSYQGVFTDGTFALVTVVSSDNISLVKGDFSSTSIIYGVVSGAYKSFKSTSNFNALTKLESGKGYIVDTISSFDFPYVAPVNTAIQECDVQLVSGINIVPLHTATLVKGNSTINGATINVIYGVIGGAYKSFKPTSSFNALTSLSAGTFYIVDAASSSTGVCSPSNIETPPDVPDINTTTTLVTPPSVPTIP